VIGFMAFSRLPYPTIGLWTWLEPPQVHSTRLRETLGIAGDRDCSATFPFPRVVCVIARCVRYFSGTGATGSDGGIALLFYHERGSIRKASRRTVS